MLTDMSGLTNLPALSTLSSLQGMAASAQSQVQGAAAGAMSQVQGSASQLQGAASGLMAQGTGQANAAMDALASQMGSLSKLAALSPTDINGLFNIKPFNPMDLVKQSSSNMMAQLQASTNIRAQMDSLRNSVSTSIADADLNAMKSYATSAASHAQDMFATSFTAPALTSITPSGVTNPLSSNLLGGVTGSLTSDSLTSGLFGEGNLLQSDQMATGSLQGVLDGVGESGLKGLATQGAGMYITAMTGGVVPPMVGAAVAGTAGDALTGMVQGEVPSMSSLGSSFAGNMVDQGLGGGIAGSLAAGINGGSLNSNALSSVLGETTASSIFADASGGTFEGITDSVMDNLGDAVEDMAKNNDMFSSDSIMDAAKSFAKSVGGDTIESFGGVNLKDGGSLFDGILSKGLGIAKDNGDVGAFGKLLDNFTKDKGLFSGDVLDMAEDMINNPYNLRNYTDLVDDLGIDVGGVLHQGASYGCDALKSLADVAGVDPSIVSKTEEMLKGATDSKLFKKLKKVGMRVARDQMERDSFRQLEALEDVGDMMFSSKGSSRSYNSGRRNYRNLTKAAERLFNEGKKFGKTKRSRDRFRFDSDITDAIDDARRYLR